MQKSNFISSERFITRGGENKRAKKKEGQTPFDKAAEEKKEAEKLSKQEEQDRLKRLYICMFVGALFVGLNFMKNPSN